ncbi:MAG: hypothetical protein ACOZJX_10055 [Pseudomonadota bacterium]
MPGARPIAAVLTAACLPILSTASLAAPAGLQVSVVAMSQPQIQVVGQSTRTLTSAEFAELRGEYRLSTGGLLVVGGARHRPVVELNDRAPVALWPVAPHQLVSADGKLRLELRTEANGEMTGLTLHALPEIL